MTTTTCMEPTELGRESASAIKDMLARSLGGRAMADLVSGEPPLHWDDLAGGGWTSIGVPEAFDGPGATLRDLVEVAKTWGESTVPLPFLPTLMAKRWSAAARETEAPVVVSIPTPALDDGRGLAPFAELPGSMVALNLGSGPDVLEPIREATADDFAPTLQLAEITHRTRFSAEAARECATLFAAEAIGSGNNLLSSAVDYVQQRVQFGQPVGRNQAVKHRLANALVRLEHGESAVIWAVAEPEATSRATAYAVESAIEVAQEAIQVHGGLGFTWEMGLHFQLRHILTLRELIRGLLN